MHGMHITLLTGGWDVNLPLAKVNLPLAKVNMPLAKVNLPLAKVNLPLAIILALCREQPSRQHLHYDGNILTVILAM